MAALPAEPPGFTPSAPSRSTPYKPHTSVARSSAGFSATTTSLGSRVGLESAGGDLGFTISTESFFGGTNSYNSQWRKASTPPETSAQVRTSDGTARQQKRSPGAALRLPPTTGRGSSKDLAITGENPQTRAENAANAESQGVLPELPPGFCLSRPSQQALLIPVALELDARASHEASAGPRPGQLRGTRRSRSPTENVFGGTQRSPSHSMSRSISPDPMLAVVSLSEWLRMHGLTPDGPVPNKPSTADPERKGRRRRGSFKNLGLRMPDPSMSDGFFGGMRDTGQSQSSTSTSKKRILLQDRIFNHLQQMADMSDLALDTTAGREDLHIIKMTLHDRNARRRLGDLIGPNLLAQLARKAGMEDFRGRGRRADEDDQAQQRGGGGGSSSGQPPRGSTGTGAAGLQRPPDADGKNNYGGYGTGGSPKSGVTVVEKPEDPSSKDPTEDKPDPSKKEAEDAAEAEARRRKEAEEEERRRRQEAEEEEERARRAKEEEEERERQRRLQAEAEARARGGGGAGLGDSERKESRGSKKSSKEAIDPFQLFTVKPKPYESDSEEDDDEEDGEEGGKKRKKRGKKLFASQEAADGEGGADGQEGEDEDPASLVVPFSGNASWAKLREDLAAEFRAAIREAWGRIDGVPHLRRGSLDGLEPDELKEVMTIEVPEEEPPPKTWEEEAKEVEEEVFAQTSPRSPRRSLSRTASHQSLGARSPPRTPITSHRPSLERTASCQSLGSPSNTPNGSRPPSRTPMNSRPPSRQLDYSRRGSLSETKRTSLLSPEMFKTVAAGVQLAEDEDAQSEMAFERMLATGSMVGIGDTTSRLQRKRYGTRLQARANAAVARNRSRQRWSEHVESCKRSLASLEALPPFRGRSRTSVGVSATGPLAQSASGALAQSASGPLAQSASGPLAQSASGALTQSARGTLTQMSVLTAALVS